MSLAGQVALITGGSRGLGLAIPHDIYRSHHLDPGSIIEACGKVLSETALEKVEVSRTVLASLQGEAPAPRPDWRALWPERPTDTH